MIQWNFYRDTDPDTIWDLLWWAKCIVDYRRTWETAALPQTRLRAKTMMKAYKDKLESAYTDYKRACRENRMKPDDRETWIETLRKTYETKL